MPSQDVITSRTNAKVKALRSSFSGEAESPGELVGIEGEHLLLEAVRSGLALETLFVRQGSEATLSRAGLNRLLLENLVTLSRDVFDSAMPTSSPQGIAALVRIPPKPAPGAHRGVLLFLEDIQDPGNLGTLIRSAEAFGAECLYVTPATVNAWSPKVMRASAGSVFRLPVKTLGLDAFRKLAKAAGITTVAAVAQEEGAASLLEATLQAPCAVMIGNEGAGLSREAVLGADQRVWIPCAVESLNAAIAGSVLLFEASRQNQERGVR